MQNACELVGTLSKSELSSNVVIIGSNVVDVDCTPIEFVIVEMAGHSTSAICCARYPEVAHGENLR